MADSLRYRLALRIIARDICDHRWVPRWLIAWAIRQALPPELHQVLGDE